MKVTRLGRTLTPSLAGLSGGGGSVIDSPPSGQVPTASGSNSWSWGSNVATIWSNGSNQIIGPAVNFASGANIALSAASNTITIIGLPQAVSGGGGSFTFSGAKATNSGTQALNNGSYTALTFDSEEYDTGGYHSTAVNTGRLTVPATGKYRVTLGGRMSVGGVGESDLVIQKNGASGVANALAVDTKPGTAVSVGHTVSWVGSLTAADYVNAEVFIDRGSQTISQQFFAIERLDP